MLIGLGIDVTGAACRIDSTDLSVWLLKTRDIPRMVACGDLDIGLAPTEWIEEAGAGCEIVGDLDGYSTRISILAPQAYKVTVDGATELRVATEYPNIARARLAQCVESLVIVDAHGSAEAYPPHLADIAVDCVETGVTAREHGLEEIEELLNCGLHLIVGPHAPSTVRALAAELLVKYESSGEPPRAVHLTGEVGHQIQLHDLPPYLRAGLLPMIRRDTPVAIQGVGEASLAHPRGAVPSYITVWSRSTQVVLTAEASDDRVRDALEAYLLAGWLRRDALDLFTLVVLLSIWDNLVRELGLNAGRVYMASEEATGMLFPLVGLDPLTAADFEQLLLEAQSLELIYRFPVAFKFRRAYGAENQCRLNGWGRRLAQRVLRDPEGARLGADWTIRLREHLLSYRDVYEAHINYVGSEGLATAPADSWTRAHDLPIPILL